jgi:plasmid stabilization system protein ParE
MILKPLPKASQFLFSDSPRITKDTNEFPELGRSRDELCQGCRSLLVKKYLVFYRLLPNAIEIVRVLHGSRNLPEFF